MIARIICVCVSGWLLCNVAAAQCATDDVDGDGVPDVCPPGSTYFEGTPAGEFIFGTGGPDCIFGFGGSDIIFAFGGDDYICGGDGNDLVFGSGGSDAIFGEGGNDIVSGGGGGDTIDGGDGDDDLFGGGGGDSISGGDGNDDLDGGGGDDALSGGDGEDNLDGGGGTNECVEEVPGTSERLDNCAEVTFASVSAFRTMEDDDGLVVAWDTTTEIGVAEFWLWRVADDGVRSRVGRIAAPQDGRVRGGSYFVRDSLPGMNPSYLIEEVTMAGGRVTHGPFRSPAEARAPIRGSGAFGRDAWREARSMPRRRIATMTRDPWSSFRRKSVAGPAAAEVVVDAEGLVDVRAEVLATALEVTADRVRAAIAEGALQVVLEGADVAWEPIDTNDGIRFVSGPVTSPFSARHRYLISFGAGSQMAMETLADTEAAAAHTFATTARFEEDVFPGITGNPDPRSDLFFWHALTGDEEVALPIRLQSIATPTATTLRLFIHGATEHPNQPFDLEVRWGEQSLGTFLLEGRRAHEIVIPLEGIDTAAETTLTITQRRAGEFLPVVYVDRVEVDYVRRAEANGANARFGSATEGPEVVTGFSRSEVRLYDITDPRRPSSYGRVSLAQANDAYDLRFAAPSERRFLAVASDSSIVVDEALPWFGAGLRDSAHEADYVVIAASHLVEEAAALADLRQRDGYQTLVVDIDDVFWEFAHGVADPASIRDFLEYAWDTWATPPGHVVLVGGGHFDYRNILGTNGNAIPPMLVQTDGGLFPSDSMLGDVEGNDGVPEIAIGRLPVDDAEGLAAAVAAIETFEATHESSAVLAMSDGAPRRQFSAASRVLASVLPTDRTTTIDLDDTGLEDARLELFERWAQPLGWVTFVGHGGLDRLSNVGLLTQADLGALEGPSAPMFLGFTCNIARFDIPGLRGIGQDLVARGQAAGVYSATGWSNHPSTDALRGALVGAAFQSNAETLGEAILIAHEAAEDAPIEVHRVYALLGDPALKLREPIEVDLGGRQNPPGAEADPEPPSSSGTNRPAVEDTAGCAVGRLGRANQSSGVLVGVWALWLVLGRSRRRRGIH
ncbi:MAG: C25 family cysteine peptidase [Myxococcota bacterium]